MNDAPEPRAEPESAAETAPERHRRRWPWILLAIAIALVGGIRVALPTVVERGAAWGSRYYLGLPARIDNADFALLEGRVVLEGVTVGARPDGVAPNDAALSPPPLDPAAALLHVDRMAAALSWRALFDHTIRVTELAIESPSARVVREVDGKVDPLRHAVPVAVPSAAPAPGPPSTPWKVALDRFDLRAPNLHLVDAPSGENIVALALEQLTLDRVAIDGNEFELGGVGIQGPVIEARRDLLLERPASAPAPTEAAPSAPPAPQKPGYHVAKIDVQRATFKWITDSGPIDIAITLTASDVSADAGKRFPFDLQMEIGDGSMGITGDIGILPPAYTGKLLWSGIPIPRILLASVPQFAPWLRQAKSSGDLAIDADPTGVKGDPATRVSGRISFDTLDVADPKGNEIALGWKQLEVVMRDVYAPLPQEGEPLGTTKAVLDRVSLVEPKIRYTRPSPQLDALLGINLSGSPTPAGTPAPASQPAAPAAKPAAPAPKAAAKSGPAEKGPLDLAIASLEMTGGEVEALDKTVVPVARTRIRGLSLEAKDIAFPALAVANVHFQAILPTTAQLDVAGHLAPGNAGDFTLKLRKLDLPVFNPYANAAAGVTVDKGSASADAKLRMRGARMTIDNQLRLHDLGVSMRDPDTFERTFGVPLDLALALLRDPSGNIELHIPVTMDEKGTELGIGAIVASALKAALIGAVTAPLKMIGAVFEGGADKGFSLDPLQSVAGSKALEGDQQGRIDGLAAMLGERQSVGLTLRGRVGAEDRPKVAEQLLFEGWKSGKDMPDVEGSNLLSRRRIGNALERVAAGGATELDADDQTLYDRFVAAVAIPDERLAALARSRAEVVRDALVAKGVPAARLVVGDPERETKPGVVIGFKSGS